MLIRTFKISIEPPSQMLSSEFIKHAPSAANSPCFSFEELGVVTTHFPIEMVSVLYIDYCLTFQSFLCLIKHVLYVFLNLAPLERQIRFSLKTLSPPANILMANF